jgi:hypothetical protein
MNEYFRPWKLATLAIGIGLLVAGRYYFDFPDWDVPISFIMAILAYVFAPWSLRVLLECNWRMAPFAIAAAWFTVDGSYAIYWSLQDPQVLAMMRGANFFASLALYGACAVLWIYPNPLAVIR